MLLPLSIALSVVFVLSLIIFGRISYMVAGFGDMLSALLLLILGPIAVTIVAAVLGFAAIGVITVIQAAV